MKFITITSEKIAKRSNAQGFTLIELIIVIGVLGVLAASLLIAINPLEQLARGRDSGRLSSVTQLGRALQNYVANQGLSTYPTDAQITTDWQNDFLVVPGEVKGKVTSTPAPLSPCTMNADGNICFHSTGADAAIWIAVDSQSMKSKVSCGTGFPVAAYIMSQGRSGMTCVTALNTFPAFATQLL